MSLLLLPSNTESPSSLLPALTPAPPSSPLVPPEDPDVSCVSSPLSNATEAAPAPASEPKATRFGGFPLASSLTRTGSMVSSPRPQLPRPLPLPPPPWPPTKCKSETERTCRRSFNATFLPPACPPFVPYRVKAAAVAAGVLVDPRALLGNGSSSTLLKTLPR